MKHNLLSVLAGLVTGFFPFSAIMGLAALMGCAQVPAATSTAGQLFCAITTPAGEQIIAGVIDADAAKQGAAAGATAVLATGLAQATVQNYCAQAATNVGGSAGVPVSPPTNSVALSTSVAIHTKTP